MTDTNVEALAWRHADTEAARAGNAAVAETISGWIARGERDRVVAALECWSGADILALLVHLRLKKARRLFRWLGDDVSLAVLAELDPRTHGILLERETQRRLKKLVCRMKRDEAVRMLASLPRKMAGEIIDGLDDPEGWRRDLSYREDSAGEAMRRGFLAMPQDRTIGDAIEDLRQRSDEIDRLDALYVVDEERRLLGYLRVRDLLLTPPETRLGDALRLDLVSVDAETDQEEVLRLAERRNLRVIAVKDPEGRLVGTVTPRELAAIARDEAEEDMLMMAGVDPHSTAHDTPLQIMRRRLPWLLAGLVGAAGAGAAMAGFEDVLAQAVILASFIPAMMAIAGNAGIQASTVTVQALSSGDVWSGDILGRLGRELGGALLNGLSVAVLAAIGIIAISTVFTIENPMSLALTCGASLLTVTTVAAVLGASIPLALDRLGIDPAAAMGVVITTSNDIIGVMVYFAFAQAIYL